jgi:1L-myo-inositol 1-phosphate cytidylyltransferase / CDP-L-myo-inositol myo-inositolphosphotransferase
MPSFARLSGHRLFYLPLMERKALRVSTHSSKCLVLAAGTSTRMKSFKPLVKIAGLPLVERVLLTARQAGLSDFYVVTGNEAERLEPFLTELGRRRGLRITSIRNPHWQNENGLSLLQARDAIGEDDFVLLMGDHLVDKSIIEAVLRETMDDCDALLAVDAATQENRRVDPEDVTRVQVRDGRIESLGKGIVSYNAFDTGVFRCHPAVFIAAERCIKKGRASVSDAIQHLAAKRRVKAVDVSGRFWLDADTPRDARQATADLCRDLGKPQDGLVSRLLNRPISARFLTPLLLRLWEQVTPNQVSLLAFATALLACVSFLLRLPLAGGLLIHLASLLDGSDGEVARLKEAQSRFGGFCDAVLDRYADGLILFGMFYYARSSPEIAALLGALTESIVLASAALAITGNFMVSYTSAKSVTDLGYEYRGSWLAAGRGRDLRLLALTFGGIGAYVHPVSVLVAIAVVGVITTATVIARSLLSWGLAKDQTPFAETRLRAVIFDLDGTVADTMGYLSDIAVGLISQHHEVPPPAARTRYLETTGMDFASQLELMFPSDPANSALATAMEERKRLGFLERDLFPDVRPALHFFTARRLGVFICSSTRQELVSEFVERAELGAFVDGAKGYSLGLTKDRQIESILSDHGLDASEVIFVGDSFADFDYARLAGVRFVALARMFSVEEFSRQGIFSVESLAELTRVYERWERRISFQPSGSPIAEASSRLNGAHIL